MRLGRESTKPLFLFVHLPKCAGTTVVQSLARVGSKRFVIVSESPASKLQALNDVRTAIDSRNLSADEIDVIMGHDVFLGMHSLSARSAYYITFLRDPVARYVSHYRYLVESAKSPKSRLYEFARSRVADGSSFLSIREFAERGEYANMMCNYLAAAADSELSTKRWEITDSSRLLELAKDFLGQMSFIGAVEEIRDDLPRLCRVVGVRPTRRVVNRSKHGTRVELEEDVESLIREKNQLDRDIYVYGMELRANQLRAGDR